MEGNIKNYAKWQTIAGRIFSNIAISSYSDMPLRSIETIKGIEGNIKNYAKWQTIAEDIFKYRNIVIFRYAIAEH